MSKSNPSEWTDPKDAAPFDPLSLVAASIAPTSESDTLHVASESPPTAGGMVSPADIKSVRFRAVVIRADGSREDLGTINYYHRNPVMRLGWRGLQTARGVVARLKGFPHGNRRHHSR